MLLIACVHLETCCSIANEMFKAPTSFDHQVLCSNWILFHGNGKLPVNQKQKLSENNLKGQQEFPRENMLPGVIKSSKVIFCKTLFMPPDNWMDCWDKQIINYAGSFCYHYGVILNFVGQGRYKVQIHNSLMSLYSLNTLLLFIENSSCFPTGTASLVSITGQLA